MGPKTILTEEEEEKLVEYIEMMVKWEYPMAPFQLKAKVIKITQLRKTLFKNNILEDSWIKCFRDKHPNLVLRIKQGLDNKKAKALNLQIVT